MATDRKFLCKQCRHVFITAQPLEKLSCPKCLSVNVEEAPAWAPLDSGSNIYDNSEWEYECQNCKNRFKMPIPKSPSEEKARSCPKCGSNHLHLLTELGGQPLYCS